MMAPLWLRRLLFLAVLVLCLAAGFWSSPYLYSSNYLQPQQQQASSVIVGAEDHSNNYNYDPQIHSLAVPPGQPPNLPSLRDGEDGVAVSASANTNQKRAGGQWGGRNDKPHLGGFTELDHGGISPAVWKHMIAQLGVKSVLDVGCGRGLSASWFYFHGVNDVLCVEGSRDAVQRSVLPSAKMIVEHDFSRGPWWPHRTYDAAWSVEFLEHVSRPFQSNYVATLRKAALIFVTSSTAAGWHHVEVHRDDWWIRRFASWGFVYDEELSQQLRALAKRTMNDYSGPTGKAYDGYYVRASLKVFVNPAVASLPQHAHLFPEHGCFGGWNATNGSMIHRECGQTGNNKNNNAAAVETPLDPAMYPLQLTPEMDEKWNAMIQQKTNYQERRRRRRL